MANVENDDIIQLVADLEVCSPADIAAEFDMKIGSASKRMVRMSEQGYFVRNRISKNRSEYTIKTVNVDVKVHAKAQLTTIIKWMEEINHPDLKLVPESWGGTNTGGGYTYQWERLIMIQQQMAQHQTTQETAIA